MKKFLSASICLTIIFSTAGCASTISTSTPSSSAVTSISPTSSSTSSTVKSSSASSTKGIEVDKGLFDVTITLPASMFEKSNVDEAVANAKKEGVGEATKNKDGSVTYKMSKATHNKMMSEIKSSLEKSISDTKSGKNFKSIKDITYNDNFSEFNLIVNKADFENSMDGFAALALYVTSAYYQAFDGVKTKDIKTKFNIIDQSTKKVISTAIYPDDLNKSSSK